MMGSLTEDSIDPTSSSGKVSTSVQGQVVKGSNLDWTMPKGLDLDRAW